MLNYILWSTSPEIYSIGSFSLRWYGLFFATGFLISQQVLYYIHRKEGKPEQDVDTLTIYMVLATIVGARLGHVIFYQPELIWTDPVSLFIPFEFNPFKFTGLQGLASHGAAIGILFILWVYSRKRKPGQNYLQVVDRIVILVAFTGALIRLGNYYNAEIIGKPTDKPWGVVFTGRLTEALHSKNIDKEGIVESVGYVKDDTVSTRGLNVGRKPLLIYIFFEKGTTEDQIENLINGGVRFLMFNRLYEYFDDNSLRLNYELADTGDGQLAARIRTLGIARHPAQMYEAISCVFLSLFLFWIWWKHKENLPPGRLLGWFLIICFGLRFCYEFLKINQESFEENLPINMGQILSIPLFIAGIVILWRSYKFVAATKAKE
jgi:phosphatidylglycerol:prolipoprotein diacylglycerol transferase